MSASFDGANSKIDMTITAMDTGDWTVAQWLFPLSAGESAGGRAWNISTSGETARQQGTIQDTAGLPGIQSIQVHATTNATSNAIFPTTFQEWVCVVSTYRASDLTVRLYFGALRLPMIEATYGLQTAGVDARSTAGVSAHIGNLAGQTRTFDGRIASTVIDATEWTLAEMERFRHTKIPVMRDAIRGWWPLIHNERDLSGRGADGTATSVTAGQREPDIAPIRRWVA